MIRKQKQKTDIFVSIVSLAKVAALYYTEKVKDGADMRIEYSLDNRISGENGSCVALGFFDGVHPGHRAVIGACCGQKGENDAIVLTFADSPAAALGREAPPLLTDNEIKAELAESIGADEIIFADFLSLKDMSANDFVRTVLRDKLNAAAVYCGVNYHFGKNGEGDITALRELCAIEGIKVSVIEPVLYDGEPISSTRIRAELADGDIGQANAMLGYPYAVRGVISSGNHIGTQLGYPTLNLPMDNKLAVPRYGVYASRVIIDGRSYTAATNIGVHPTVGQSSEPVCESFLLDYNGGELYGESAKCELVRFVRPEMKFSSAGELCAQVARDIAEIRG